MKDDLHEDNDYCHAAHTEEGGIREKGDVRQRDSIVASCVAELAGFLTKKQEWAKSNIDIINRW